ncbi:glycoside hydrolase family 88 protein [uncultured Psychrobacter sp.]|uniref:glycoside hydrolase family 88 protein n=1 Tax=uncultured Psychrobacter sp. TaxID=259303 RepID=UPI0026355E9F|nr:glycoside hydrolase family 88 protein [uncultured Psychrobacter sp.]
MYWLFFIALLITSIISLLLLYVLMVQRKLKPAKTVNYPTIAKASQKLTKTSLRMLKNKQAIMSFNDEDSLYVKLARVKAWLKRDNRHKNYAYFNFPLAFLLLGLLDRYESSGDTKLLEDIEQKCTELVSSSGQLIFTFDKVDQAMFGLVFLRLYTIAQAKKYLTASNEIYKNVLSYVGDDDIVRYRKGVDVAFIDTIGLVCPFLIMYADITDCKFARVLAEKQVDHVLDTGLDKDGILPFHAVDLNLNAPLGSINWGRGIGWWVLGLAPLAAKSDKDHPNKYFMALQKILAFLERARLDNEYWPQFIGHTNDNTIDSSATLMFLLATQQAGIRHIESQELLSVIGRCVDSSGKVINASGDTIYINKYSRVKGASELAQGLMLSLISEVSL